jgi:hypothetical protein
MIIKLFNNCTVCRGDVQLLGNWLKYVCLRNTFLVLTLFFNTRRYGKKIDCYRFGTYVAMTLFKLVVLHERQGIDRLCR